MNPVQYSRSNSSRRRGGTKKKAWTNRPFFGSRRGATQHVDTKAGKRAGTRLHVQHTQMETRVAEGLVAPVSVDSPQTRKPDLFEKATANAGQKEQSGRAVVQQYATRKTEARQKNGRIDKRQTQHGHNLKLSSRSEKKTSRLPRQ